MLWAATHAWIFAPRKDGARRTCEPDELPPLTCFEYLAEWFLSTGVFTPGGLGAAPLTWAEIEAWARSLARELSPFEAQALRRMSEEYCSMLHRVSDGDAPPPYLPEGSTYYADLNKKLRRGLDAMVTRK